jgi:predicted MFS family arabinose efflux permease
LDRGSRSTARWPGHLVAFAFAVTMLGTTLPTPLYPIYEQRIGFSSFMVTVVFAAYAVGVIAALLLFGRLSDDAGRRPVLLAGLGLSAASAVLFLLADGLSLLLAGRVLSGLSAGVFTGTATATLLDLAPPDRRGRATLIATAANMGGLGCGPLLAGLLAQYAPLPVRLCFIVDLVLVAAAIAGLARIPETVEDRTRVGLRLQGLLIPTGARALFVRAATAAFAGFAVLGLFTAVAPAFLGQVLKLPDHALTGAVVFAVFAASLAGQVALERTTPRVALPAGCLALVAAMGLLAAALDLHVLALLVAAGILAGLGQGLSFRAGLASVTAAAGAEERGAVSSSYFVVAYVAISIPVVGVGLLAELTSLQTAGLVFAAAVAALALAASLSLLRQARTVPA